MTTHQLIAGYKDEHGKIKQPDAGTLLADLKRTGTELAIDGAGRLYAKSGAISPAVAAVIAPVETEIVKLLTPATAEDAAADPPPALK